jgi:transcriptional regulator with PAS, ATPase and Fis domain
MRELRERIAQIAATDETVLICGESGTGKELVAQSIHTLSRRSSGPFVSLNCPVLSAQLTESELFGHKRGAFTGAESDRTGRFELGNGGSILLDEVTEIDLGLQAKLLRVLQERSFERVGSSETIRVDVRVLATTNRELPAEIAAGRFREDLYYRLAVVPITLPPLRDRHGDSLELAEHFLAHAALRLERKSFSLETAACELLANYHWPGNVRELQNVVERAVLLGKGEVITLDDLPSTVIAAAPVAAHAMAGHSLKQALAAPERQIILEALEANQWNRHLTAEALGINRTTLYKKMKRLGLEESRLVG